MSRRRGIVVSHPVHHHAYESAVAAQRAGLLLHLFTGFYWTHRGVTDERRWRRLPPLAQRFLESQFRRRTHPDLDPSLVRTISRHYTVEYLARRSGLEFAHRRVETWARERFDLTVAHILRREAPVWGVHAFEGSALHTFQAAKAQGATTILDVPAAYEYFWQAIIEEGGSFAGVSLNRMRRERELADWILVPSDFVYRCLRENGVPDEKLILLPYGVDPQRFTPTRLTDGRPFRYLYVGLIGRRKGVRYLLEAWRRAATPGAELILVGPVDDYGRQLVADLPESCKWVGEVPHPDVHAWFSSSDVFVFPSLAEGSAYVTYEAMAAELALIVTPNTGAVIREGAEGLVVPARDSYALAKALERVYTDRKLVGRLGREARQLIQDEYTWEHYRERLTRIYTGLINGETSVAGVRRESSQIDGVFAEESA